MKVLKTASLLMAFAVPLSALGSVDLSILEDGNATETGGKLIVSATSSTGTESIVGFQVDLDFLNASNAGVFPVDLQVQSLVPGLNLLSTPFGTLNGGIQNDVGLNETVEVVAFGNGSVGTNTPLLEIVYSLDSSFTAPNQFTVRLLDTTSIGDLAPGALTPIVVNAPVGVPEPSSFLLLGLVLGAVGLKKFYSTKKTAVEEEN